MVWKAFTRIGVHTALASLVLAPVAPMAWASEFELSMNNGRVTILAQDVSVKDILAEWGRVGNTTIVDADQLEEQRLTLELVGVPEAQALRTLLRTASGYMAAPRAVTADGVSRFDRILIMATTKPVGRVATVASPGWTRGAAPSTGGAVGQRLGVVPSAAAGRTPFTVTPSQQGQLDQLQQLLQRPDDRGDEPEPAAQPAFGNMPAARPGMPMTGSGGQETTGVPTGTFGSTTPTPDIGGPRYPQR